MRHREELCWRPAPLRHWDHCSTSAPIAQPNGKVRQRSGKTRTGCVVQKGPGCAGKPAADQAGHFDPFHVFGSIQRNRGKQSGANDGFAFLAFGKIQVPDHHLGLLFQCDLYGVTSAVRLRRLGRTTWKVLPAPGILCTPTVPPWASTMRFVRANPRPAPWPARFCVRSSW